MVDINGRRYKLWWCTNNDAIRGVGILVKENIWMKVVEVRGKSDRVTAIVLVFEKEVIRVIYAYAPQMG